MKKVVNNSIIKKNRNSGNLLEGLSGVNASKLS